LVTFHN